MSKTSALLTEIDRIYKSAKQSMDEYQLVQRKVESERDISWSQWYEVPISTVANLMLKVSGFEEAFKGQVKSLEDWLVATNEFFATAEGDLSVLDSDPAKAENKFIELVTSLKYNHIALEQRNKSITEMVAAIRSEASNASELVLEAISIDPTAMSSPTIEKYIRNAATSGDERFLKRIPNALMKKAPRPRQPELDQLRWMMMVVASLEKQENPSVGAMVETNDLLKLMNETEDTIEAIRHHIKTRRTDRGSL
ncbi:hypothetical protein J6I90_09335 [Pseudidiomarina sp. 1APP75-32.1]|uniref:Uncharacterized protein n=1 Tax=Pseudidiomarina terrestris TaxID=2820060 RepID=A0AAW7QY21_9GAMM|nr:hypothetical protein [Pseudidiomarina sp. 1APP75-32.1]MDN7125081.1 hypothetical protein [Pseudidiomarina sp. 1APP75-32.1]